VFKAMPSSSVCRRPPRARPRDTRPQCDFVPRLELPRELLARALDPLEGWNAPPEGAGRAGALGAGWLAGALGAGRVGACGRGAGVEARLDWPRWLAVRASAPRPTPPKTPPLARGAG
jgi:hypothetical protein